MQEFGRATLSNPQLGGRTTSGKPSKPFSLSSKKLSSSRERIQENTGMEENQGKCGDDEDVLSVEELTSRAMKSRPDSNRETDDDRDVTQPSRAAKPRRPLLDRKSRSDLASYRNVNMKILVEGREVLNTNDSSSGLNESHHLNSVDQVARSQRPEDMDKKKNRSFVSWLSGKAHWKTREVKILEKTETKDSETPGKKPTLRRSRSFSGRIRDKIKSFTPSTSKQTEPQEPQENSYLELPLFYKTNLGYIRLNREGVPRMVYPRRHSDQTDSMTRRPIGTKKDSYYYSLDRGRSTTKPLTRKRSNSLERPLNFPLPSRISDGDRSRSCTARIRMKNRVVTHQDNDGMLETNLCSTEL